MDVSGNLATLLCKYQATKRCGVTVIGRNLLVLKKIKGNGLLPSNDSSLIYQMVESIKYMMCLIDATDGC